MNCKDCNAPLSNSKRECPACAADNGFPNVRAAASAAESDGLAIRVQAATTSMLARNCATVFRDFGHAVKSSRVVIARSVALLQNLVESDKKNYTNYHRELLCGIRNPEDNEFDSIRTRFESALFPNYHSDITYGCLTLNDQGVTAYGQCFLILKEKAIAARSTVFEENPYVFAKKRTLALIGAIPPGYRATWASRDQLAQAKLHSKLTPNSSVNDFPGILLSEGSIPDEVDFIEVHIFGPINAHSVEKVVAVAPKTREDKLILKSLGKKLNALGIEFRGL